MRHYEFSVVDVQGSNTMEIKIFALPDHSPQAQIHERNLHPYVQTPTPRIHSNVHYQYFYLTNPTTFLAKILEGRHTKQAYVHINPSSSTILIEDCFGPDICSIRDIYEIVSCFTFKVGNRYTGLTNSRYFKQVPRSRRPFIVIKCLTMYLPQLLIE